MVYNENTEETQVKYPNSLWAYSQNRNSFKYPDTIAGV